MQNPGVVMRRWPPRGSGCRWRPFLGTKRRKSRAECRRACGCGPAPMRWAPIFDHCICCFLAKRLSTTTLTGDFHEGGRDRLTVAPTLPVVRDDGAVVVDVAGELGCRPDGEHAEPRDVGRGSSKGWDSRATMTVRSPAKISALLGVVKSRLNWR